MLRAGVGLAGLGLLGGCGSASGPAQTADQGLDPDQGADSQTPFPDMPPAPDRAVPQGDILRPDLGPPLPRTFDGYKGLEKLPFFELDAQTKRLRCTVKDLPPTIDFHAHLGFRFLTAPKIDYLANTPWTKYLIDQIQGDPPFTLDLDVYLNNIATKAMRTEMDLILGSANTVGSPTCKGHTIVNLIAEMDRMGVEQTLILPLVLNFPFGDNAPRDVLDAYDKATPAQKKRLIMFGSVHPKNKNALTNLQDQIKRGIRGVKIHPTMQRIYPNDPDLSPIYAACEKAGIPIFWHGGRTGLEPNFTAKYAEGKHYTAPLYQFPKLRFVMGHCGAALDWQTAVLLAKQHPNLYLETAGQGIPSLEQIVTELGPERVIFGTDWPFYPQAATLAKILIMTRFDKGMRRQLLRDSALALMTP